jgi:hypothetical protein
MIRISKHILLPELKLRMILASSQKNGYGEASHIQGLA